MGLFWPFSRVSFLPGWSTFVLRHLVYFLRSANEKLRFLGRRQLPRFVRAHPFEISQPNPDSNNKTNRSSSTLSPLQSAIHFIYSDRVHSLRCGHSLSSGLEGGGAGGTLGSDWWTGLVLRSTLLYRKLC